MNVFRRSWPALLASAVLVGIVLYGRARIASATGGSFTYPLDDSYIHMAIAKNLAAHGVWGPTSHGFASASSSPLWTVLLAATFLVAGPRHDLALWMNLLLGIGVLLLVAEGCRRRGVPPLGVVAVLACTIGLVPLVPVVMTGMEHTLHIALVVGFVDVVTRIAALPREDRSRRLEAAASVLAMLLCAVRYESAFLVALGGGLVALRGRAALAAKIWGAGAAPILAFGVFSMSHGWPPVPASVLVKSAGSRTVTALGFRVIANLWAWGPRVGWLVLLCVIAGAVALSRRRKLDEATAPAALFVLAAIVHAAFATMGSLHRYEAYLVAAGLFAVAAMASIVLKPPTRFATPVVAAAGLATAIALAPFPGRALALTWRAGRNIHEQQVQMGRFLARHFPAGRVAANDIGAISFFADPRLLDTAGLADLEVARARLSGSFGPEVLDAIARARGAEIAVVYATEQWLPGGVPPSWRWVGAWGIEGNVICGSETVFFFAVAPEAEERLRAALLAFQPSLPATVHSGVLPPGSPDAVFDPKRWSER